MKTIVNVEADVPAVTVNILPVKIQYTGPANTKDYFTPSKIIDKSQDRDVTTAYFRGLKLAGETVDLGDKVGYICNSTERLKELADTLDIETVREYSPIAKFDQFTVYGHDSSTSENNKWKMMKEWEAISDAVNL